MNKIPILGQPVFILTENPLEDRVQLVGERGYLNSLTYFAVDAIVVKKIEYDDIEDMNKIILNKGLKDAENSDREVEIHMDLRSSKEDHATIFVDEEKAQAMAKQMNLNQQKTCKKLLDLVTKGYSEYDKIIISCTTK